MNINRMDVYKTCSHIYTIIRVAYRLWFGLSNRACLTTKPKNLVAVESIRLDAPAIPIWCWSPGEFSENCWSSVFFEILKK